MDIEKFDRNMALREVDADGLSWYAPHEPPFRLAGFPWFAQDRVYRRLPLRPPGPLPEAVDGLAWCTAGGQVRFRTDSPRINLKVRLRDGFQMDHMPQTGIAGFDLYLGEPGHEAFHAVSRYALGAKEFACELFREEARRMRTVTINFPLYRGVEEVLIGLEAGAAVAPPPAYPSERPVVVYGTSITQGGCASRPGLCYTNILSRRLDRPFVNLGFSGSGRGEPELARAMALVPDPALLVLDYEANCDGFARFSETLPAFIAILRASHPAVPILLVSRILFGREFLDGAVRGLQERAPCLAMQRRLVRKLRAAGDRHIHILDGARLLGKDFWECTVDHIHPTDLGFHRMATVLAPVIGRLLAGRAVSRRAAPC